MFACLFPNLCCGLQHHWSNVLKKHLQPARLNFCSARPHFSLPSWCLCSSRQCQIRNVWWRTALEKAAASTRALRVPCRPQCCSLHSQHKACMVMWSSLNFFQYGNPPRVNIKFWFLSCSVPAGNVSLICKAAGAVHVWYSPKEYQICQEQSVGRGVAVLQERQCDPSAPGCAEGLRMWCHCHRSAWHHFETRHQPWVLQDWQRIVFHWRPGDGCQHVLVCGRQVSASWDTRAWRLALQVCLREWEGFPDP